MMLSTGDDSIDYRTTRYSLFSVKWVETTTVVSSANNYQLSSSVGSARRFLMFLSKSTKEEGAVDAKSNKDINKEIDKGPLEGEHRE